MTLEFLEDLEELSSAEDFLDYFELEYEPSVVFVNRLHIMQRFHDYLTQGAESMPEAVADNEQAVKDIYKALLARSYQDFVESDAVTEKVFKVFKMQEPQSAFVPVDSLFE